MKKSILGFVLVCVLVFFTSGLAMSEEKTVQLKNEVWAMAFKQMIEKHDVIMSQAAKASGEYPELVDCFGMLNMLMQLQYDGDICPPWPPWPRPWPWPWPPWWLEDIRKWVELTQPWEKVILSKEMNEFFQQELTPREEVVSVYQYELERSAKLSQIQNLTDEEKVMWNESQENAANMKNDLIIEHQFQ